MHMEHAATCFFIGHGDRVFRITTLLYARRDRRAYRASQGLSAPPQGETLAPTSLIEIKLRRRGGSLSRVSARTPRINQCAEQ